MMRRHTLRALVTVALCFPAASAAQEAVEPPPVGPVTRGVLEAKIAELEASSAPNDTTVSLVELYRQALSSIEIASEHAARTASFEEATRTAPGQAQRIRDEIEGLTIADPLEGLDFDAATPREPIERQLMREEAELAAADARRADFDRRLPYQQSRLGAISQRLSEATYEQGEVSEALAAPPEIEETPALARARRWVSEARHTALSTEIKMLEQELSSLPARLDLLEAKRDHEAVNSTRLGLRVRALSERVNRGRQLEAEQARNEAEDARREVEGREPSLVRLAERNAALTDELNELAAGLDVFGRERAEAETLAEQIAADHENARETLESGALTVGLGQLLLEQRENLPDMKQYRQRALDRKERIAEAMVRRLNHQSEARRVANVEQAIAVFEAEPQATGAPESRLMLRSLLEQRQRLLDKALEADEFYLRRLRELDDAENEVVRAASDYETFLNERLLWIRSSDWTRVEDLKNLPTESGKLFARETWSSLALVLVGQAGAPVLWLSSFLAIMLLWKRPALIAAITRAATGVGRPKTDRFMNTLAAVAWTLALASPLPLLIAATGWQLQVASRGGDLSNAVGASLLRVALHLYMLLVARAICLPDGLAVAHFRWPDTAVRRMRVELGRLTWLVIISELVVRLAENLNPAQAGGLIARLGFVVYCAALAWFFYRVLGPSKGVLEQRRREPGAGILLRSYPLWFALLLIVPLVLACLGLAGYLYTADNIYLVFQRTLWMLAGLIVVHALAVRLLRVTQHRLAYDAAVERRLAAFAALREESGDEAGSLHVEEPEIDLDALSDDSRQLLDIVTVFAGVIGVVFLWSPLLPALQILDDVTLWYYTTGASGALERIPVTLKDLALALVYAIGVGVLAKRLPAVLEMLLLQRSGMSAADRYTVVTLSSYVLVAIGFVLVLGTLGVGWSQVQWLVAALGVGIGFGLQEIVANFISGLIILFERPIRVGDVVTVGDNSGVVTRIQIRATTIRDWERKELLVPNKEFITGRLLNWSLSDEVTRVVVVAGVDYGADADKALALMKEAAAEQEHVLGDPAPIVTFEGFGDNALTLMLRAYVDTIDHRLSTITDLHKSIGRKFDEAGIAIAVPQRDLHLDAREPLRVSIESALPPLPESGD